MNRKFLDAMYDIPPPPCDDGLNGCIHRARCAKGASCRAFWLYLKEQDRASRLMPRAPTRAHYDAQFARGDK